MAVEGWAPDYVLAAAKHEFGDANAVLLLTTGLPLERGMFLSEYKDFATLAAATLAKMGMESGKMYPVPAPAAQRDRTAAMVSTDISFDPLSAIKIDPPGCSVCVLTDNFLLPA